MKALTLLQPYASLVPALIKRYETRSWQTSYRGPLAITASAAYTPAMRALARQPAFRWALRWCPRELPLGSVIAVCELTDIVPVEDLIGDGSQMEFTGDFPMGDLVPSQFPYGDFSPGRFVWKLEQIRELPTPVPCKGHQRLWELTQGEWEAVNAVLPIGEPPAIPAGGGGSSRTSPES